MKKFLGAVLILGGVAIIGVIVWGKMNTSKVSDEQRLIDAALDLRAAEAERVQTAAELSAIALEAPETCNGLTTGFVYDFCEMEPDPGVDWPIWTEVSSPETHACVLDAFHRTNEHAFKIQGGEPYVADTPEPQRVARFISDICSASLFTDGVDWGDQDADLTTLINGYYVDRSQSRVTPGHDY